MHDMNMENDNSSSSSVDSPERSSIYETIQKMELGEKSCSKSEEGNPRVGIADEKQKASSSGSSRMDDQLKYFAQHSKGGATDNVSSENVRHPDEVSQLSTDELGRNDEKNEKFKRNLEKFFKERKPLKEVQLRKNTEISSRLVRSDGEMANIFEYCGDVLKLSSTLSNTERSSAPPTFNNETEAKQKCQTEKLFCVESSKKNNSKEVAQPSNILEKDEVVTGTLSPTRALELRLRKISEFKVPISPDHKTTPDKSAKMVPSGSNEDDVTTPVQMKRPTYFNAKPRKAFYTFSPGSSSGVLKQSQSLPDINRPRPKDEAQRRSINFGEHSRIVRFLFKDKPEPATPESKVSFFYKSSRSGENSESPEIASEEEVPMTLQNIPSKICRKLVFSSCSKETAEKNQNAVVEKVSCVQKAPKSTSTDNAPQVKAPKALQNPPSKSCRKLIFGSPSKETTDKSQQTDASCDAGSPSKRKKASPVEAGCSISTKKVKTLSEIKFKESGNCENVRKNASPVDVEYSISAKKVRTSSEITIEDFGKDENVKLSGIGCSIAITKVRTSSGTKMERGGSGENVRKNTSPIDVECSVSAKKVKTSSEIIVESGCGENVLNNESPVDVSSISAEKIRTFSETKIEESESG